MAKLKWKGKDWYQIVAPKFLREISIGETPAIDPNQLKGRVIETSLMELTNDPRKYYIKVFLSIDNIDGNRASTRFHGHNCTRDYIARIVQIRTSRIDTNDVIELKDGKIRLKTIAISNRAVQSKIIVKLRRAIRKMIKEKLSEMTIEDFVKNLTFGKVQIEIKEDMSKIYPLRFFEFRSSEVVM